MIADSLKNIELYKGISEDIYAGLVFLREATADIEPGEYPINANVKALVSEYVTKEIFERGYEAHRHVIDIQYPIVGCERVKWSPLPGMSVNIEYDEVKDKAFYVSPSQETYVDVGNGVFGVFFPEDTHSPQHYVVKPEMIKKITIKVTCFL